MYPAEELNGLIRRKAELRSRIAAERLRCAALAARAAKPLVLIDKLLVQWHRISPYAKIAAVPLAFILRRKMRTSGFGLFRRALRWAPMVLGAARAFADHRR